jgi:hypothetical protein
MKLEIYKRRKVVGARRPANWSLCGSGGRPPGRRLHQFVRIRLGGSSNRQRARRKLFWKGMLREFHSAIHTNGNSKPIKRRYGSSVPRSESKL